MTKSLLTVLWLLWSIATCFAQVPTPESHFGFPTGTDYHLANYSQTEAYFKKIAERSERARLVNIGTTEEGRNQYIIVITSPENHQNLQQYKEISQKMARAEGLTSEEARALAKTGKPVVWIDGGLHSTEMVGTHQLIETLFQLTSRTDEETMDILDKVVILLSQVNPDGQELVANWYMQEPDQVKRNMRTPTMYHKYIGHDNNRDFFMLNMKESTNISLQQYVEWMPQIIYNHHQTGPAGTVLAGPPYRDPFNFAFDPLLITGLDGVAAAMINRLNTEDKPGYTRLSGSYYSTWWNGGLRTTPYFHNMIGILTEIIGGPAPAQIPVIPQRLVPDNATPNPVMPQKWHFRQSIDYSVSLNYAVLNYARRFGDELLFNIYKMGKNAIDKGSKDHWTLLPKRAEEIRAMAGKSAVANQNSLTVPPQFYDSVYKNPALRDPRGFIIPASQEDFPTAIQFVNALIKSGIQIHKATADFAVEGKNYPSGSYIVKTSQAFRPHVMDMFEPQNHPNDFQYPGGPPVRPYDAAGWTLALQMGIQFDRIMNSFDGPFIALPYGQLQFPEISTVPSSKNGYILKGSTNVTFKAVNLLLKKEKKIFRTNKEQTDIPTGTFYLPAAIPREIQQIADQTGATVKAAPRKPANLTEVKSSRIALFDYYGGSMPSGWVRWIMEQHHFDFQVIYPQDIDKGNLKDNYDIILFISGGVPPYRPVLSTNRPSVAVDNSTIPAPFRHMTGSITSEKSIPALKTFAEAGGILFTVGSSTSLAYHLGIPVKNGLTEIAGDGSEKPLPGEKYYIPGSILKVKTDSTLHATQGVRSHLNVMFNNSPVFQMTPESSLAGIKTIAWFESSQPLMSGWAWGQGYLYNKVAAFEAPLGKGKLYAFGPEITFRAQSHGTFRLLFNQLYQYR